ncbi:MAG: CoA-acylating methylmalonate-semialdehyde dehydrogenase [Gammaproteobacteria bacterium]|nr:CoA-acylating methylmalonate-semialdehyde dehydrogenase [Gammaproteobacteria bacterium]MDH4313867.1 CoA-acylating methylmalonate-semialdehyde dehydrogenase [Gammaproteobacteria bacterium]MDH5215194.1 CoA-acylating methylmalonate-semialdehyde dehydrogenase [Gammaproteobacteria bacterium]MDH5499538.1 CoA-acylating methylmalonate-semialdehyde dehydrogenase [Gammaproteobacteria bacterium]
MRNVSNWIGGEHRDSTSGRFGDVHDSAIGKICARVGMSNEADVAAAVSAAQAAFESWSKTPVLRRARVMFRLKELIERDRAEIAALITQEHGKVLHDADGSIQRGLEIVEFACGIPHLQKGEYSEQVGTGVDSYSMRQPLGVCVGITPFNFPAMVPLWMFPLAIACGNTFVLKPSEKDPSCSLKWAELLHEAGLPPGVFNVVQGDHVAVNSLLGDERVAAVSFVGSTAVAEHVYRTASHHGKRVQALGGAKNHLVVMPDADMDQAADALLGAGYGSAGERCMAISAIVAVGGSAEPLLEKLLPKIARLKIGPGADNNNDMGPLITAEHRDKVRSYIDLGEKEGAKVLVDGRKHAITKSPGYFLGPTLFDNATPDMRIYQEEVFGPVLTMTRVDTFDDAIRLINNHQYGNGTAIFTRDGDSAREFANSIQVGMVGINVPIPVPLAFHSFGGWKRSVFGDMGMYGLEGVRFYTKLKTVTSRWPTGIRAGADFSMPTM